MGEARFSLSSTDQLASVGGGFTGRRGRRPLPVNENCLVSTDGWERLADDFIGRTPVPTENYKLKENPFTGSK